MSEWRAASPLKTASLAFAISRGLLDDIQRKDEARRSRLWRHRVRPIQKTEETVMKVLMVITSHDQLGNTGRKTGFWLEELAAPYYVFKDAGVEITLASPKGGRPPIDPKSNEPDNRTELTVRFEKDAAAEVQLDKTLRLDSVRQDDFDTLFYLGGHGRCGTSPKTRTPSS
jgi:hypothetical protein